MFTRKRQKEKKFTTAPCEDRTHDLQIALGYDYETDALPTALTRLGIHALQNKVYNSIFYNIQLNYFTRFTQLLSTFYTLSVVNTVQKSIVQFYRMNKFSLANEQI